MRGDGEFGIQVGSAGITRVETHDLRQHQAHGMAVRNAELGRQWVGRRMGRAEHAVFDGRTGPGRPQQHPAARLQIRGGLQNARQTRRHEAEGLP